MDTLALWNRRQMLRLALGIAVGGWMSRNKSMAAPFAGAAKITAIKALQLDFQFDGCLIKSG